MKDPTTP